MSKRYTLQCNNWHVALILTINLMVKCVVCMLNFINGIEALQVRPYLFEKLLLGFILLQNGSVFGKKKKGQPASQLCVCNYKCS